MYYRYFIYDFWARWMCKDKRAEELKYVFAKAEDFERITGSYIGGLFVDGNVAYFCDTVTDSSTAGDTVASAGDSVSSAGVFASSSSGAF